MCKKIFSLAVFFSICIMMIFSCCETQKEEPEDKPAPVNPETPVISTVSQTLTYKINEQAKDLTVVATVTDGGVLSYQWYNSDSLDGEYTAITNALEKDYKPDTSVAGTTYYKCTVTNTLDGKTASADTPIFTVVVTEIGNAMPPKIVATTYYPIDFNKEATLKVEATSLDEGTLSYKWSKSSDNINFSALPDETPSLKITSLEIGTFYYQCEVTNKIEVNHIEKTAVSKVVITVTVTSGNGNINIDFN